MFNFLQTAIAAAISLKCYTFVQTSSLSSSLASSPSVTLSLPDQAFSHTWSIESLPWSLLPVSTSSTRATIPPRDDEFPDQVLLEALDEIVLKTGLPVDRSAGVKTFLYLYMNLCSVVRYVTPPPLGRVPSPTRVHTQTNTDFHDPGLAADRSRIRLLRCLFRLYRLRSSVFIISSLSSFSDRVRLFTDLTIVLVRRGCQQ